MTRTQLVLVLLGVVVVFAMLAPFFLPEERGPNPHAAILRTLPPLERVSILALADGGELPVVRRDPVSGEISSPWRIEGDAVFFGRGGGEGRRSLSEFALDERGEPRSRSRRFWLGTDDLGRDLLPRILAGARVSLLVALSGVAGAALLAALIGVLAGYAGGAVALVVDMATEAMLSLPRVVLLMVLGALLDPGPAGLALLLALTGWPAMTRLVRAEVRQRARSTVALAGRAAGGSPLRVAMRHVLPFALGTLAVAAGLRVGPYVLLEASLSFLGFGVDPPAASWGQVIADGSRVLLEAWWVATLPGLALLALVLLVNRALEGLYGPGSRG